MLVFVLPSFHGGASLIVTRYFNPCSRYTPVALQISFVENRISGDVWFGSRLRGDGPSLQIKPAESSKSKIKWLPSVRPPYRNTSATNAGTTCRFITE